MIMHSVRRSHNNTPASVTNNADPVIPVEEILIRFDKVQDTFVKDISIPGDKVLAP